MATLTFNYDDAAAGYDIRLGSWDGTAVHSPYEIQRGDKFYFRTCKSSQTINGTAYESNQLDEGLTLTFAGDITIVGASGPQLTLSMNKFIIEASTPRLSVDVSTLAGWANLSAGSHDITIVAKASGFKDSAPSAAVKVTKAASTKTLAAGTYKWKDSLPIPTITVNETISFISNSVSYSSMSIVGQGLDSSLGYGNDNVWVSKTGWTDTAYQTITLATDQQVSVDFYEWAITGGNLVKQAAGETWVLNESSTKWGTHNFTANFTSNNKSFTLIKTHSPAQGDEDFILYNSTVALNGAGDWTNQAYRTLTFATAPSGDLLTWLQANGKRAYSVTITKATLLDGTATIRDGNSASASAIATLSADTDAGITVYPTSGNLYLDYSNSHGEPGYSWYSANWENPTGDINIDKNYLVTVSGDGTIEISASYYTCLTGDTLISLADGSQKRIDEIQLTDKVLAYNPETLTLESDEIIECDSNECKWHTEYDIWTFSDGTVVQTVLRHRFYNVERQEMVYMDEWNIGEHTIKQDGSKVALISHKSVKERVRHYTIFTKHQNYFANGLLSGNRYTKPMHLC